MHQALNLATPKGPVGGLHEAYRLNHDVTDMFVTGGQKGNMIHLYKVEPLTLYKLVYN